MSRLQAAEGRFEEAVGSARAALALEPSFLPARRALALVAEREGRIAEAIGHWRSIAQALPKNLGGEAIAHLRRLEGGGAGVAPSH